jgi:hypothetical protein
MGQDYLKAYVCVHKKLWEKVGGAGVIKTVEAKKYLHWIYNPNDSYLILREMEDMGMLKFLSRDIIQLLRRPKELDQQMITA